MYSESILKALNEGPKDEDGIVAWGRENSRGAMTEVMVEALLHTLQKDGHVEECAEGWRLAENRPADVVEESVLRVKHLVKNGVIQEPESLAGAAAKEKLQRECALPVPVKLNGSGNPQGKYNAVLEGAKDLGVGEEYRVFLQSGVDVQQYKKNLIPALSNNRRTRNGKWEVRCEIGVVIVKKVGEWGPPGQAVESTTVERSVETTQQTKVVKRVTVQQSAAPAADPKKELSNSKVVDSQEEFLETCLEICGPYEFDECHDERWDLAEKLAYRVTAEREAAVEAEQILDALGKKIEFVDNSRQIVLALVSPILVRNRLLELELTDACRLIRKRGDPCQADSMEQLLPEKDRQRLRKEKP